MKNRKNVQVVFICCLFLFSACRLREEIPLLEEVLAFYLCTNKKTQEVFENNNLKIIDINQAQKEDQILLSDLFSSVKTIILETNDNILLGEINGLQVYNGLIFILDKHQDTGVYIFDKNGEFVRKIGRRGDGPGEYLSISDFTIDRDNNNIYLLDCDASKIHKYKITGEFENSITLKNTNIQSYHLQYIKGKLYTDINYIDRSKHGCMVQEINPTTGKQKVCWLDPYEYNRNFSEVLLRADESFFYSRNQESFKFVHFFMNTVISFNGDCVEPVLTLNEKDWITHKDILQIEKDKDKNGGVADFESLFKRDIAFNINNYMEWGDFISFQYQKKDDSFFVLHNVKTQTTRITPLLIDDLVYGEPALSCHFACTDSTGLYGITKDGQLLRFIERVKKEGFLNPGLDKIDELKNIPEDSNPIIFLYEFKDTK